MIGSRKIIGQSAWALAALAQLSGCMTARTTIPPRPDGALEGRAFVREIAAASLEKREMRIREEIVRGNIPDFLRRFAPVEVTEAGADGTTRRATFYVAPDYLAVGSDADFVRMPMTPATAQAVAGRFGCVLPTRKMVDAIHERAVVQLEPAPFSPAAYDITSVEVFLQSHAAIERQRAGLPLGLLVSGIKKDVVITPQLAGRPDKVAIYGWHRPGGKPIQPLYLGHTDQWVDYSHGIRLVAGRMEVDGRSMSVAEVLADPELAPLLSDEGAFDMPRY